MSHAPTFMLRTDTTSTSKHQLPPIHAIPPLFDHLVMSATIYLITAVVLCVSLFCAPSVKTKSRPQRLGRDPGLFNLRAWLARISFLSNGRKIVDQGYRSVSSLLTLSRCQLTDPWPIRIRTQTMLSKLYLAIKSYLPQSSCLNFACFRRVA